MKTEIQITPNRERGYDATVYSVRTVRLSAFMRTRAKVANELEPLHTTNAPSEGKARELAAQWLVEYKTEQAAYRAQGRAYGRGGKLSESDLESREAVRNEERAHGCD